MLEKLLGVKSFAIMVGHLTCHHVILPISSKGFGLFSMVRFVAPTFLGCWVLITHALITYFQRDDHLIILDAMAYVETNIFLFQLVM
jgi:hypothetical protein